MRRDATFPCGLVQLNTERAGCTQVSLVKKKNLRPVGRPRTRPLTWNTGDAEHVGVAHKEGLQDVASLVGVDDDGCGGGLGARADPNQRRQLVVLPQLLLLLLEPGTKGGGL